MLSCVGGEASDGQNLCAGDKDRPAIRGTKGHLSPHQGVQSPVPPDVLSHAKGPGGFVQKSYESLS